MPPRPRDARSRASSRPATSRSSAIRLRDPDADVEAEAAAYRPPFAHLALLLQLPGIDIAERLAAEKGTPLTERERAILEERVAAARAWLERYAPDAARIEVRFDALPEAARNLAADERRFLAELAASVEADASAERRGLAGEDLRGRRLARSPERPCLRRPLPRLPRAPQRPAGGLAPGEPRPRLRRQPAPRSGRRAEP
ncbi:MAG: hypothetical protein KatS3mg065_1150 [Chloroflexota bacterium]|nr:MAG: hypothetical protein KatS3mg065_1150 [Chloroflexota bacterium]